MFGGIPGLGPLDASITLLPHPTLMPPDIAECLLGSDSALVENHRLRVTPAHHLSTNGFSH